MKKNIMLLVCSMMLLPAFLFGNTPKTIAVYLTDVKAPYSLTIKGKYQAYNYLYESEIISALDGDLEIEIIEHKLGLKIEDVGVYEKGIVFDTTEGFNLNGVDYYGDLLLVPYQGKMIPVNRLSVEDYVKGVLPHEMSPDWPIEALKAQAVAARTYAMYHILLNDGRRIFDVDNTTKYQVYNGKAKINNNITQAVESTKYEVMTYNDKVIAGYFSALCGGHTDSSLNVFGVAVPYLDGVTCNYCNAQIKIWTNAVSYDEFNKVFAKSNIKVNDETDFKVKTNPKSDKVISIDLNTSNGKKNIEGSDFRNILTPKTVPSLTFRIDKVDNGIVIIGQGSGHAVGLCQWGAYGMAQVKKDYKFILPFYYKGVVIKDYTTMGDDIEADIWRN